MRKLLKNLLAAGTIALSILTFASDKYAIAQVGSIVIDEVAGDSGGSADTYLMWYNRVRASGVPVIIRGLCSSACTFAMFLPREQICIEPTASLGFHLFSFNDRPNVAATAAYMRWLYPPVLVEWLKENMKLTPTMNFLSAADIVAIGAVRACDEETK